MTTAPPQTRKEIAARLLRWYRKGEGGLQTICAHEDAPVAVREAVTHWFAEGWKRMGCIIEELEREDAE